MVATIVLSGWYLILRRMKRSEKTAMPPTKAGAKTRASKKPQRGSSVKSNANQEKTAPSMKNSPCAILTIRITPKTSDRPKAINAKTKAVTVPSNKAKNNKGPFSLIQEDTIR